MDPNMTPAVRELVARFRLAPHPEGGFFREVFRSATTVDRADATARTAGARSSGTFIYFLLADGDFSAFHRVRSADEIWHLYAGGPLELHTIDAERRYRKDVLASDLARGEPAHVVPAGWWQAARLASDASFAFCGCTVAPGFDFADFEMPPAAELVAAYPSHERIIHELTRR
jgi:predicted cupin superfamily sugar epimerase